ncbi:hypothetical protein L6164_015433 [Bauhinia variegata]|uniref:Uncharacterized protein n=1 Tax=Bauhinia variegata TaxID=167791 RepID=A0ACB9NKN1_BAUVA|nr:hypothetical protein L6164_015433 [Bauhinia variegata]
MAIFVARDVGADGKHVMSVDEFKRWLNRFDTNNDGRISKAELREAVRQTGAHFATWKTSRGFKSADINGDGFIDKNEFKNLVDFAEKYLNIIVVNF